MKQTKIKNFDFPNGVTSYLETHFEIVGLIYDRIKNEIEFPFSFDPILDNITDIQGQGGLYELAEDLTTKFETIHKGRVWDGDYFHTLEDFFNKEIDERR